MENTKIVDSQLLYFMASDSGLVKIGISNDPKKRALALSSASGMRTLVIATWQLSNSFAAEQELHYAFSKSRKRGEWFSGITQWDVDKYINENIEISKIIIEPIEFKEKKVKPKPHRIFCAPCVGGVKEAIYLMTQEPKDYDHLKKISDRQRLLFQAFYPEITRGMLDSIRESTGAEVWATNIFPGMPSKINHGCYSMMGDYFLGEERAITAQILHNEELSRMASAASDEARHRLFCLRLSNAAAP